MIFILSDYLEDLSICDELIELHKNSPNKKKGAIYNDSSEGHVDPKVKLSTDIAIENNNLPITKRYTKELDRIVLKYAHRFKFCADIPFAVIEPINVQHYAPNEGFFELHSENYSHQLRQRLRHLVFMTYLNDVTDGGETEFYYQSIKIIPKKGLTLIWPAEWMYTHKGIPSPTQDKYIITGWFSFLVSKALEEKYKQLENL